MKALKWFGGAVLVLFVAIVLFFTFGLNMLRGPIERAVEKASGRELVIEGDFKAVWSWVHPRVRLEGVRFRRARVESVDGALRWAAPVPAGSSLELTTHRGGVEMVLPRGTAAELNVSSYEGGIRSTLPGSPPPRPKGKGHTLGFTLGGGGGSQVTIRSFRGAVTLRHP